MAAPGELRKALFSKGAETHTGSQDLAAFRAKADLSSMASRNEDAATSRWSTEVPGHAERGVS